MSVRKENEILSKLENLHNEKEAIDDFLSEFNGSEKLKNLAKKEFKLIVEKIKILEWIIEEPEDLPF